MKCQKCNKDAILYQKYSNAHLCRFHFIEDVERKIKRDIRKYRMLEKGETAVVALSGGKDSTALLYILNKIFGNRPDIDLAAITIDEGISGYREHTIKKASEFTKKSGITHIIKSFKEYYGLTLDEIMARVTSQPENDKRTPCTYCGVLRKTLLNRTARELGADKLATGHNLDDEAQSILMNYLRGDVERLVRLAPKSKQDGLILRAKPLRSIPEKEVALYCMVNELPLSLDECPYSMYALRNEARSMVNSFEKKHPGTKYSLLKGFETISGTLHSLPRTSIMKCRKCGEPGSDVVCKACKLVEGIAGR